MASKVVKKKIKARPGFAKNTKYPIVTSEHLPATQGMLILHQKQFKADLRGLKKSMEARFNQIDAQISTILSEVHRMAILMEEQNSRNKYVLDGYDQIYKRQERLEVNVDQRLQVIEDLISSKR